MNARGKWALMLVLALGMGCGVSPAMAGLYDSPASMVGRLTRESGFYGGSGGEFTMRSVSGWNQSIRTGTYSDSAVAGGFQTFCLEYREHVSPPQNYYFDITSYATAGGLGGGGAGGPGGSPTDALDSRTAFLYTKFRDGSLAAHGYDYGAGRSGSSGSALALQRAIWAIEQERSVPTSGLARSFYDLADDAVAVGGEWHGMGLGDVRVMNLWGDENRTQFHQDQLVMIPAPGAALLGILGLGVVGLIKRRLG